ncbi:hypothetical protein BGZ76_002804 [Entomortierella beljakovae]|nr:hypothetical protein BGZ76_002804 [Entomortierella beljakovae]
MRRYRRGGAVSAFAVESFITMPSDKDLFHLIQDSWRQDLDQDGKEKPHDVIVLDQDMKAGNEEFGRSPSPAWTLVSVLERGGGNCGSGAIRLWYLEGGYDAFQAWDQQEKYMKRPGGGSTFEMCVTHDSPRASRQDVEMNFVEQSSDSGSIHPHSMPLSLPSSATSSTFTDSKTAQAIDHAVSLTNASLGGSPRRGPPVRRESLFSLNTKSLPRPASLSRSQTIGVSALNIKPTSIPPPPTPSLHPLQEGPGGGSGASLDRKGSWLTVPNGVPAPSISPLMSLSNNSMENTTQSASSENNSMWSSSRSTEGGMLSSKKSFSSTTTLLSINPGSANYGIQEEEEDGSSVHPFATGGGNQLAGLRRHHSGGAYPTSPVPGSSFFGSNSTVVSHNGNGFQPEYQSRTFADGIDSYTNNSHLYNSNKSINLYEDELGEEDGEQEISCILSNFLFLGPEIATEEQAQELERLGIKRVLNMARECEDLLVVNRPGMEYFKIGVQDHIEADVGAGLMQAVDVIAAGESPIYVHCKAGKSRSVTAIIAYLITQLHWSLNKAYNHVLTQRPCMCPNIGFVTELMRMEERMLGNEQKSGLARAGSLNSILSLSTAGSPMQHSHHQYAHHSLQNHHALGIAGTPKVLSTKSSMNSLAILSPPFQPRYPDDVQAPI